ncbi:hypothetical protein Tco_0392000, partial [Tanacetum coccineum]
EDEMKRSLSSTSTSQNLAFLSSENTSSTNEVACSFFAQPTTSPQLENEDFQQIDEDDLEVDSLHNQAIFDAIQLMGLFG